MSLYQECLCTIKKLEEDLIADEKYNLLTHIKYYFIDDKMNTIKNEIIAQMNQGLNNIGLIVCDCYSDQNTNMLMQTFFSSTKVMDILKLEPAFDPSCANLYDQMKNLLGPEIELHFTTGSISIQWP